MSYFGKTKSRAGADVALFLAGLTLYGGQSALRFLLMVAFGMAICVAENWFQRQTHLSGAIKSGATKDETGK